MENRRRNIYKTSIVLVLATVDYVGRDYVGQVGTVTSRSGKNNTADVEFPTGQTLVLRVDDLVHIEDPNKDQIIANAQDAQAEAQARAAERRKEREVKAREEYIEKRLTVTPASLPYVRENKGRDVEFCVNKVSSRDNTAYTSGMVFLNTHLNENGEPEQLFGANVPNVSVSWAAVGSQSPEEALAFANAVIAAAHEAMNIRTILEDTQGLTEQLETAAEYKRLSDSQSDLLPNG